MTLSLRFALRSDVGRLRSDNEDSAYAGPRLAAVADGMGGHAAGEVASQVVIASMQALDDERPPRDLPQALREAVSTANGYLRDMVAADSELEGMGTTLTALLADGSKLGLVHVGDSRAYRLHAGHFEQITVDHTLVQSLIDSGRITPEEAAVHPRRSMLTRTLDGRPEVEPDVSVLDGVPGDRYLICSDGLSGVVTDETLEHILKTADRDEAADRLVELALKGGGPDNITVIVADVIEDATSDQQPTIGGAAAEGTIAASLPTSRRSSRRHAADAAPATAPVAGGAATAEATRESRPLLARVWLVPVAAVVLIAGLLVAAVAYNQRQFYVGSHDGYVALYQGLPGISTLESQTPLRVEALGPAERSALEHPSAGTRAEATALLEKLLSDAATATPEPTQQATDQPTAQPSATPTPSESSG